MLICLLYSFCTTTSSSPKQDASFTFSTSFTEQSNNSVVDPKRPKLLLSVEEKKERRFKEKEKRKLKQKQQGKERREHDNTTVTAVHEGENNDKDSSSRSKSSRPTHFVSFRVQNEEV